MELTALGVPLSEEKEKERAVADVGPRIVLREDEAIVLLRETISLSPSRGPWLDFQQFQSRWDSL